LSNSKIGQISTHNCVTKDRRIEVSDPRQGGPAEEEQKKFVEGERDVQTGERTKEMGTSAAATRRAANESQVISTKGQGKFTRATRAERD